jgi:hypothetical protein
MKTSRWKRYDEKSGLWIASSKSVYGYWFRFLIHAENDPNRQVDWSLYEDWGGKDYIQRTTQNEWWKTKWKTLFGYKEGEKGKILYPLSKGAQGNSKPQPDGIRLSLMVYELKYKPLLNGQVDEVSGVVGDKWEIAKWFADDEFPKRKAKAQKDPSYKPEEWTMYEIPDDWVFHTARKNIVRKLMKTNPEEFRKKRKTLQSRIGRYMKTAEKHLDNVCKGQFP